MGSDAMTSKERMLTAMRHGKPDRVPVAPDMSNMIPCKLTGKPFWDIYHKGDPPLWKAYVDAVRFFEFDGWHIYAHLGIKHEGDQKTWESEEVARSEERFTIRTTCHTPAGDLWQEVTYYIADPPTVTRKFIKDLKEDMPKMRYLFLKATGCDRASLDEQLACVGDLGVVGLCVGVPGMQSFIRWFDGGLEAAVYAEADYPDEFAELAELHTQDSLRQAEMAIDAKPDFFMIGASGMGTLNSRDHLRRYSMPVIQKVTRWSREAGIPSFLHSCGKQREMIDLLANETDLDVVNPLEIPPMGDCDLAEIKRTYGHKLALMGNVHTTDVMLFGTPDHVRAACRKAIDDAAEGGGFILSTGDQCGRDTPFENIRAMVETAKDYGRY
jgi:uroporphyrinogen decarboxylase